MTLREQEYLEAVLRGLTLNQIASNEGKSIAFVRSRLDAAARKIYIFHQDHGLDFQYDYYGFRAVEIKKNKDKWLKYIDNYINYKPMAGLNEGAEKIIQLAKELGYSVDGIKITFEISNINADEDDQRQTTSPDSHKAPI